MNNDINNNETETINAIHEFTNRVLKDICEALPINNLRASAGGLQLILARLLATHKGLINVAKDADPLLAEHMQHVILSFFFVYVLSPSENTEEAKKLINAYIDGFCDVPVPQFGTRRKADEACKADSLDEA